jgi:hypothetical protein
MPEVSKSERYPTYWFCGLVMAAFFVSGPSKNEYFNHSVRQLFMHSLTFLEHCGQY